MKLIFLLVVACLELHNGIGAPRTAVYKFVRCNPEGGNANCVTQQTSKMPWSPDLPSKLPAADAKYLDAEPIEGESPSRDEKEEVVEEETPMRSEDGESPWLFPVDEGSAFEGSATDYFPFADQPTGAESEPGSGESWTDSFQPKVGKVRSMRRLFAGEEAKPTEQDLQEDSLLKM